MFDIAAKQSPCQFSFNWNRVGDYTPLSTNPNEPSVLSFQRVSEGDFGYYRCEVSEAGKMILTIYRALYRGRSIYQGNKLMISIFKLLF